MQLSQTQPLTTKVTCIGDCLAYVLRATTLEVVCGLDDLAQLLQPGNVAIKHANVHERVMMTAPGLPPKPRFGDLDEVGLLGRGGFGEVKLVRDHNGNGYALKQMSKG